MSVDDFPKNRGDWSGPGRTMAMRLGDQGDDVWLRSRRFGATARNKGGHLVVTKDPVVKTGGPFIWAVVSSFTGGLLYKRFGWGTRKSSTVGPMLRTPGYLSTGREMVVGGGYVLQLAAAVDWEPGSEADPVQKMWLSLIYVGNPAPEVSSLSAENVPGANVSFYEEATLPARIYYQTVGGDVERPSAFVTGWDPVMEGYGFGFIGREKVTDRQITYDIANRYKVVAYLGNTATRRLTRVELPTTSDFWINANFNAMPTGPGRVQAIVSKARANTGTEPPSMLRTDDYGRTWTTRDVPELVRFMLRTTGGFAGGGPFGYPGFGLTQISPLDEAGTCGMIFTGSKEIDRVYDDLGPPPEYGGQWAGDLVVSYYTRFRFFVSDTSGQNWTNKPWPADEWLGPGGISFFFEYQDYDTWSKPLLSIDLPATQRSAGGGSFYAPVFEYYKDRSNTGGSENAPQRVRMLYTVNYGNSWALSPYLEAGVIMGEGTSVWPIVAKPFVSLEDPGELYVMSITRAGALRIYRTTAVFETFTLVHEEVVDNYYFENSNSRINGLFVGDTSGSYPARVMAGFPQFQKP